MTRVTWDALGQRIFHTGIDRGMLYVENGVVTTWSGLAGVTEAPTVQEADLVYVDGRKILNIPGGEDFAASLDVFYTPPEFAQCAGRLSMGAGLYVTDQPKLTFGLSYRTRVGNDASGTAFAYKVHIIYNAIAILGDVANASIGDSPTPVTYSWAITAVPVTVAGRRPTAHVIFDTRLVSQDTMNNLETILYGDETHQPSLPTIVDLTTLLAA